MNRKEKTKQKLLHQNRGIFFAKRMPSRYFVSLLSPFPTCLLFFLKAAEFWCYSISTIAFGRFLFLTFSRLHILRIECTRAFYFLIRVQLSRLALDFLLQLKFTWRFSWSHLSPYYLFCRDQPYYDLHSLITL